MHIPAIPGNAVLPLGDPRCQAKQLTHQLSSSLSWLHLVYELATVAILHYRGVRPACISKGAQSQKSFIPPLHKGGFLSAISIYSFTAKGGKKRQLLQQKASCLDSSKSSHSLILICLVPLSTRCKMAAILTLLHSVPMIRSCSTEPNLIMFPLHQTWRRNGLG